MNNCIVYYNSAPDAPNHSGTEMVNYSCTTPMPTNGVGNITNAPLFVDAAGNFRIVGGTVDIGAYELQSPQSTISYTWLQQYGLPINASADFADLDRDGHNNWQEWRGGTDPIDALSALRMLAPETGTNGVVLRWQSVSNRTYSVERGRDLTQQVFNVLATNVLGRSPLTTYTDTNAPVSESLFYRVRVEE